MSQNKLKNIWIFHHYADPPDGYWIGTYELYKFLAQKGHRITVFSSSFSHYTRKDEHLTKGKMWVEKTYDYGMKFIFIKTHPYYSNNYKRFLNMITYSINSWRIAKAKISFRQPYTENARGEIPDIVIGSTPHPFCVLTSLLIAKKSKARFFMELHDLWTEYMVDAGQIHPDGIPAKLLYALDNYLYTNAEKIFALWPRMNEYLKEKFNIPYDKVIWTPLGIDFENTHIPPPRNRNNNSPFVIICTARMGPASNIEEILQAAKILKENEGIGEDKIQFHLYGDGPKLSELTRFKIENNLDNVIFKGLIPKKDIPLQIAKSDVCIAGLPSIPHYAKYGTIPTKIIDYIASNRPVIFITDMKDSIVDSARCGFTVPPGNTELLAQTIKKLFYMSDTERAKLGENGIEYLKKNHDLKKIADKLEEIFIEKGQR